MVRFIFITGGVISSLGKGLTASCLAALLQDRGFSVKTRKLDPYLNVDAGTMNPLQHGEVFVTNDGTETDLDLGHYERFTDLDASRDDITTSGSLYLKLLDKERKGDYLGNTVQVIPHFTNLIKEFILNNTESYDFILYEIGGTIGDIEGQPFIEAIRQLGLELPKRHVMYIHMTVIPYIKASREMKTKPTQHSVKALCSVGIQPDILVCRSEKPISLEERKKIALFCNIHSEEQIIPAIDTDCIYKLPIALHENNLDQQVLSFFNMNNTKPNLDRWYNIIKSVEESYESITVALIGKYTQLEDSYKSLLEALDHAAIYHKVKLKIRWVSAKNSTQQGLIDLLQNVDAILIPGGFGHFGIDIKILAIQYARENNIPILGICMGMQLMVVESARNLLNLTEANSTEYSPQTPDPVISLVTEWNQDAIKHIRTENSDLGASMRLGAYECCLKNDSFIRKIYDTPIVYERHRHRYEVNTQYREPLEKIGLIFSGTSKNEGLIEVIEYQKHPWFIGTQFHPELKSRPFKAHPLFKSFIAAAITFHGK